MLVGVGCRKLYWCEQRNSEKENIGEEIKRVISNIEQCASEEERSIEWDNKQSERTRKDV